MGIPKFYRWISERYPCLSEKIREYQIPEFDNLYLDMNGIIHSCSHPNDEDIHLRIPEKNIFSDIFQYIDFLFKMIKPRRTFFMAVDGVAPRAKMNQQRGRRFRSAKLAEEQESEAIRKGEALPSEERFDSNCITPGTEFMARLHEQLQYFAKVKVSTDPLWQREGLTIILSGHDVPGEGEHKIMDYIRHIRSQPNYDPDTRHCLYGLDADLIMLGLSTHELRFSLLREEVKFSRPRKNKKDSKRPQKTYDPSKLIQFVPEGSVIESRETSGATSYLAFIQTAKPVAPSEPTAETPLLFTREEDGARGAYRAPLPEKTTFLLLHLSLLRDYIDEEFQGLRAALEGHPKIVYDLEKVIDDWILLSILIGNDFVPHLPMLHIVRGAFPMLYNTYAALLPKLDGYLNDNGTLHLGRLEIFLQTLSSFDLEVFRETYDDMKYMESKTGRKIVLGDKMFEAAPAESSGSGEDDDMTSNDLKALIARTEAELKIDSGDATASQFYVPKGYFDAEDSKEFGLEFLQYKRNYYMEKMGVENVTVESIRGMAEEYVRALQWVLLYYYKGVSSWGWFYPHHYGPFCSDIHHLEGFNMEFVKGQPFKPFEQLLGVLPSHSGKLLPKCFYDLMINAESPILDFYPKEFENDLNGKRNDWEAVVLIPFIDETRLLTAMGEKTTLTEEEIHRNSRGKMHCYRYTSDNSGEIRSRSELFLPMKVSHFTERLLAEVTYDKTKLPKGLHPNAKRDKIYQGFPTLKSIEHTSKLDRAEIKVFEFITREESMLLSLPPKPAHTAREVAKVFLNQTIWVNWPHLTSAYVTGVSDGFEKYIVRHRPTSNGLIPMICRAQRFDPRTHRGYAETLIERHLTYKGIHLGNVDVLVWAATMEGRRISPGHRGETLVQRQWSNNEQPFALETTIHHTAVQETFMMDRFLPDYYLELFNRGDLVVCIGGKHFGCLGTVKSLNRDYYEVVVDLERCGTLEENLSNCIDSGVLKSRVYYTSSEVSSRFKIPGLAIAKLTGTVYLAAAESRSPVKRNRKKREDAEGDERCWRENIGLNLKFNKRNLEVRGYTRKNENQWMYSRRAVDLLLEYSEKFPEVVNFFSKGIDTNGADYRDSFAAEEFFPQDTPARLESLLSWINDKGLRNLPRVPINSKVLDDDDVITVWEHVVEKNAIVTQVKKTVSILAHDLHKPGINRGCVGPGEAGVEFELLDRVVSVDPSGPMPLGQRGTIVGIQNPVNEERQEEEAFRSTSATVLKTLIVLPDPIYVPNTGIHRRANGRKEADARQYLISLLKIKVDKDLVPGETPKLLSFYPFQLLNISQYQRTNRFVLPKQPERRVPLPSAVSQRPRPTTTAPVPTQVSVPTPVPVVLVPGLILVPNPFFIPAPIQVPNTTVGTSISASAPVPNPFLIPASTPGSVPFPNSVSSPVPTPVPVAQQNGTNDKKPNKPTTPRRMAAKFDIAKADYVAPPRPIRQ